ncbi:MAG: deoxyribodipyrimidine photo-lyase [Phycisphaerales bacterium]
MRPLVWFRADLRTADNSALLAACKAASDPKSNGSGRHGVVGVFLLAPDQWQEHDWAPVKVDLILRTLAELSKALAALNIPLKIIRADRFADAPKALLKLARACGCDALYFNKEYEINEARRDEAVRDAFEDEGMPVHAFTDQTLLEPGDLRTTEGKWYTVYTPFKKAALARLGDNGGVHPQPAPDKQAKLDIAPDPVPDSLPEFDGLRRPDLWPAGEGAAMDRLHKFAAVALDSYHERRDSPATAGTSTLSPYLAIGAISPRQCAAAAIDAEPRALDPKPRRKTGPSTWLSEVLWREFYKHLLVGYPRVVRGRPFRLDTEHIEWRDDPEGLEAWKAGRTGVPIVDAGMRQLAATGWMHNRLRMVTAMFLTKNLLVDWREGERHFMRNLVDGDLANNNGGWQWSASTGTDAAPYFRVFNPVSQSRTHDPDGTYIRRFVPELADVEGEAVHEPWTIPGLLRGGLDYPSEPIVDLKSTRERAIEAFRAIKA